MNFNNITNFYFLGIGGIGMSSLARYFNYLGKKIIGYDKIKSELTINMENEGIMIYYHDDIKYIPYWVNNKNTIIVYTSALLKNNKQMKFFISNFFYIKKRAEILGLITKNTFCISIAGTHGKTTTSALLSHIFNYAGKSCLSFIGGILKNYNSNIIIGNNKKLTLTIVEADEYDHSFLYLSPNIICITSIDNDHLDIYYNYNNIINTYINFCKKLKPKGKLFINSKISSLIQQKAITYSIADKNSNCYSNFVKKHNNNLFFNYYNNNNFWKNIPLPIPGMHNLENTTAAISIALYMNINMKDIINALKSFKGIERRFSIQHKSKNKIYIDDYAHHPTEINCLIKTIREEFYGKKILGIFQPHLFSRTKFLEKEFIKSLQKFDSIMLLDIYPAREQPIIGINSQILLNKIFLPEKEIINHNNFLQKIKNKIFDIIITIGAGDIDKLVIPIKKYLDNLYYKNI